MNNLLYNDFAARFAASSLTSLIESFNQQVGNRGFNSARAAHDIALINELRHRGIDISAISNGNNVSFAHHVVIDNNQLKTID